MSQNQSVSSFPAPQIQPPRSFVPSAPVTLADKLLQQARERCGETAVRDDQTNLSYGELVERAYDVASVLKDADVDPGCRIGLFVESSVDMMVGLWGILFAGGAYLPLGTDYPVDRLSYMIRDAGIKVIITQEKLRAKLAGMILPGVTVISIETVPARRLGLAGISTPEQRKTDLAYLIYTSGTTGAPKGVRISQEAVVQQLTWLHDVQKLKPGQVILQKTPASFDAAQWELLAVCCGAEVVMGRPGIYRDPLALIEQIRWHKVTMLQGVPTLLQALVDTPEFALCTSLTSIFSGGEALTRKLSARIFEARPGCRLVNLYGPTECTINSTSFTVDPESLGASADMIPIGRPVTGTPCFILNEKLEEVRNGESGELYIGGPQLAEGYHNRPDLTAQRFIEWFDRTFQKTRRLYKTGDLVHRRDDGVIVFEGRADNQVKFRGYRVELDEIRVAIENHDWVKSAGVFVKPHPRTQQPIIVAGVELNPREAQTMDQGNAGSHHRSKKSRLQVRAQLSDSGLRCDNELIGRLPVPLPGATATPEQRALAFARKTYRFFEGGDVTVDDLLAVLTLPEQLAADVIDPCSLTNEQLGHILRYLGQFQSNERLLPKLAYASPGALYATQVYLEVSGIAGLEAGYYYYHPGRHMLYQTALREASDHPVLRLHFVGKIGAIEPVYKNNIREVLEFEAGHILGLLDHILPSFGLGLGTGSFEPESIVPLDCSEGHVHLAAFDIVSHDRRKTDIPVEFYVQAHGSRIAGLPQGQYVYRGDTLIPFSSHILEARHVIAINQKVYERGSGMISLVSRSAGSWHNYIDLGRALQRVQQNDQGLGAMSSGYSSKSGNPLAAAIRLGDILAEKGVTFDACYSAVIGKISETQRLHEGMHEDSVHMEGPEELIRKDLQAVLPDYMVPSKIVLVASMPYSASGKVDVNALKSFPEFDANDADRQIVTPRNITETRLSEIWREVLTIEELSIHDDFFEVGGNSLQAVQLVLSINKALGVNLPVQVLFEFSTVAQLAARLGVDVDTHPVSRAVTLKKGEGKPIFCWPGLGGYPMNLRHLANGLDTPRPFIGVQALGVNAGECTCPSIQDMALRDATLIREIQPRGPYTLWGYSFGARVAYETSWHLEQAGQEVEELILIAPGSPELPGGDPLRGDIATLFKDASFLTILYSVFAQTIAADRVAPMIAAVRSEEEFIAFIASERPELDVGLITRITRLVAQTYTPEYGGEMTQRVISAPVRLFKAQGDSLSFLERVLAGSARSDDTILLAPDHYQLLKQEGVKDLVHALRRHTPSFRNRSADAQASAV